jgi:hypothetical protein
MLPDLEVEELSQLNHAAESLGRFERNGDERRRQNHSGDRAPPLLAAYRYQDDDAG